LISSLESLDHRLFLIINKGLALEALDPIYEGLSSLGEWTILLVAISLLVEGGRRKLLRHIVVLSLVGALLLGINTVVKESVDRPRPPREFQEEMKEGTVQFRILGDKLIHNSMPSGHCVMAFYLMSYVGFCNRSYRFWALLLATLIAVSRIAVGVHFPSDCVVGALLGAAGGWAAWQVFEGKKGWGPAGVRSKKPDSIH
jgi:undecaprenyl-diphosphatase